ncbi:BTAD domain-containing putative transcriptional regulator [Nonomuraea zeae]|uniref:SARP family transcriptional regulator n=1 Tax=Nonomuraea zeae TaxID=1642303 RepID=A0A5S4G983_9ACTN|nr:BTAD domain-containing putative transcriptional regulator [Nonomuraea zeae]TMR29011.1 SARP family transcriptional regulator [Nonomuraea zeae]
MTDGNARTIADFRVLGPLEVRAGGLRLEPPGRQVSSLLAALLIDAPEPVTEGRLLTRVWGPEGGSTAALRTAASRLRSWLHHHAGLGSAVRFALGGYRLDVPPEHVDARRFRIRAAAALEQDDPVSALAGCMALWRGNVLADASEWLRGDPAALRLDQERLACASTLADLALAAGRAHEALGAVEAVALRLPYHEAIQARLLRLLGACGRRAEALWLFESVRRRLAADLGVDPSPPLQEAHLELLRDPPPPVPERDPPPRPGEPARAPCLLPPDIADFTGRQRETAELSRILLDADSTALPVAAVSGRAGMGKSALVVHVAHRLRDRFPDGQLYVDMRGSRHTPTDPSDALARFLRALGAATDDIPASMEERAERFRCLLSHRRLLVLLDDAADTAQIEPLLPGVAACGVLVTSRKRLTPLAGAQEVRLGVLDPEPAVELLARIAGGGRVAAEAGTAYELAALTGHLPLALRVAGARLAARAHWSVRRLTTRLADERHRLDELAFGELDVRAGLTRTYCGLEPCARHLLHTLGLLDVRDFAAWVAAALLDCAQSRAEDILEQLVDAQLLEVDGGAGCGPPRYRFPDLVRIYARERAKDGDPRENAEAVGRAHGAWLALAEHAHRGVHGGDHQAVHGPAARPRPAPEILDAVAKDPLAWLESEREAVVTVVRQAAEAGQASLAWELACTCAPLFRIRDHVQEWSLSLDIALTAAREHGDVRGQAAVLFQLGPLRTGQERYDEAAACFEESLALFSGLGHRHGRALALSHAAALDARLGHADRAERRQREALAGLRAAGDRGGEAYCLRNLGRLLLGAGDLDGARRHLERALAVSESSGARRNAAQARYWLGTLHLRQDRLAAAEAAFEQVLAAAGDLSDAAGQAMGLLGLGEVRLRRGARDEAVEGLREALDIALAISSRRIQVRVAHALARATGGPHQVVRWLEETEPRAGRD